jgi:phosphoribosylaminoimidazolecarboxamide formyltransferase/IMP cyclohydrolase
MPRALISVSDKTGLDTLARALLARGYELVSTGGTGHSLAAAGIAVRQVADITGFPEMMDGRLKTLHPRVHGGILARRSRPDDLDAATRHEIPLIDLVVVNLYPFVQAAARADTSFADLVEAIDIGGPALVRAAAKNFTDVLVVVDPADYEPVIAQLDRADGPSAGFRLELSRKAFAHTARYDSAIASTLAGVVVDEGRFVRAAAASWPPVLTPELRLVRGLRYGENPHQTAAWYAGSSNGFGAATVVQGQELSYTNLLDLDAALRIALEFDEPAAVVVKHTNPCGVATGDTVAEAYTRARDADPLSAFGGIVAVNRAVDVETARALAATKIDAVVTTAVAPDAVPALAAKAQMRVVVVPPSPTRDDRELRSIAGAVLVQSRDAVGEASAPWPTAELRIVTKRQPTAGEWRALRFAWRVCAHVKSNAVIFTGADRTLAIGAGQMSRVDAVSVAVTKAHAQGVSLTGSAAASDAFFPFRDGLDAVAAAGATAVVQPGGSVKDAEVIAAADEHGLAMVFAGRRHFRH